MNYEECTTSVPVQDTKMDYDDKSLLTSKLIDEMKKLYYSKTNNVDGNDIQNSEKLTQDLCDTNPIEACDAHKYGVIINVPYIYINADENENVDKIIPNLRVINYERLVELIKLGINIFSGDKSEQQSICDQLVACLSLEEDDTYTQFIELLKAGSKTAGYIDVDEDYVDVGSIGVSFDLIRNYVVDPVTGVLQSAEPITINGIQLYSQLAGNENDILAIRKATNDTDFNRIQYYLSHFQKQLTFQKNYVVNQTVKAVNLGFFFMGLYAQSRPILGYSSNDLKSNILSYIIDLVVRSRVMQAWQRDLNTKILLSDLVKNYDNRIHIIKLCQLYTPRERAMYFLNLVKNKGEISKILQLNFYDKYISLMNLFKMNIEGKEYYSFGSEFLVELGKILPDEKMDIEKLCKEITEV